MKAIVGNIQPIPETLRCEVFIAHPSQYVVRHGLVILAVSDVRVDGSITQLLGDTVEDVLLDDERVAATGVFVPQQFHVQNDELELHNLVPDVLHGEIYCGDNVQVEVKQCKRCRNWNPVREEHIPKPLRTTGIQYGHSAHFEPVEAVI